jgi:hypothetical protein
MGFEGKTAKDGLLLAIEIKMASCRAFSKSFSANNPDPDYA